jgi:hypothetical protein
VPCIFLVNIFSLPKKQNGPSFVSIFTETYRSLTSLYHRNNNPGSLVTGTYHPGTCDNEESETTDAEEYVKPVVRCLD